MNWINPEQNLVGSVKQIQNILQGTEKITEDDNIYTLQQCENEFFKQGGTDQDAKEFFIHYDSQGWLKGNGLPITGLSSQITKWRLNPIKPKEGDKQSDIRKALEDVANRDRRKNKGIMAVVNTRSDVASSEAIF
jgi:hypothetical protein